MQSDKMIKSTSPFFVFMPLVFLFASGVAQAQCIFFTGFADNKDGTVTDTRNGLIWKRCAEGFEFSNGICEGEAVRASWETAHIVAQESNFLDKEDWRVPTKEEYESVLGSNSGCSKNHHQNYAASKAIAHMEGWYWSASTDSGYKNRAWGVSFLDGYIGSADRELIGFVRLVRSGGVVGGQISKDFVNEIADRMPRVFKAMHKDELCEAYGEALRAGDTFAVSLKKELSRRKIKLDDSSVRKEAINMGISECQLYASWGMPVDQNRTVGSWGVHIQHVFGTGTYVYTENGRVTSWQN